MLGALLSSASWKPLLSDKAQTETFSPPPWKALPVPSVKKRSILSGVSKGNTKPWEKLLHTNSAGERRWQEQPGTKEHIQEVFPSFLLASSAQAWVVSQSTLGTKAGMVNVGQGEVLGKSRTVQVVWTGLLGNSSVWSSFNTLSDTGKQYPSQTLLVFSKNHIPRFCMSTSFGQRSLNIQSLINARTL